jgi:hypothetical protein
MCGGILLELPLKDDDDGVLEFVGDGEGVVNSLFLSSSSSLRKEKKSYFSSSLVLQSQKSSSSNSLSLLITILPEFGL